MPDQKPAYKFYGTFEVLEKVGTVAYRFHLPQGSQMNPVGLSCIAIEGDNWQRASRGPTAASSGTRREGQS